MNTGGKKAIEINNKIKTKLTIGSEAKHFQNLEGQKSERT